MPCPDVQDIIAEADLWESLYEENNQRGRLSINFGQVGDQWDEKVVEKREITNKESLTFNMCLKHNKKIKSQFRQIDFNLNIYPTNQRNYDSQELNCFKMLFNHFMMSDAIHNTMGDAWDKMADFGYSFVEVNYEPESPDTLSLKPVLRMHDDPSIAFWDSKAFSPTKIDGAFCGMIKAISDDELYDKYDEAKGKSFIIEKNTVIEYWYRDKEKVDFVQLVGGEFKRKDLINEETDKIYYDSGHNLITRKGYKDCIYYMVVCNDNVLVKPKLFPTEDLPLVYHFGLTIWTNRGYKTFPFTYAMEGSQKLHNFTMSQIATLAKNVSASKYFLTPDHIQTPEQKDSAVNISKYEGAIVLGAKSDGTTPAPFVVQPPEMPISMLQLGTQTKQEIDEIAGAFIDGSLSEQSMISGKAIGLIAQNMNMSSINAHLISSQIIFIDSICKLFQQMLPKIVTEQRCITIRKEDGLSEDIYVNQLLPTGKIKNNIKDIRNTFLYTIQSSPSMEMQQENSLKALMSFYNVPITPDFAATKDLFARNLPIKDIDEFEKRILTTMDPMLIKYTNGEITKDEYMKYIQQAQAQQQQMQMQQIQMQQQLQQAQVASQQAQVQVEQQRANSMQYNEETKRMKVMDDAQSNDANNYINMAKVQGEQEIKAADHALDQQMHQLEVAKLANQQFKEVQELNKHVNN